MSATDDIRKGFEIAREHAFADEMHVARSEAFINWTEADEELEAEIKRQPQRTPQRECYLVLVTRGAEIRGIGLFSEETPTTMGMSTFVVGSTRGADFEEAHNRAVELLKSEQYAWAGEYKESGSRQYREHAGSAAARIRQKVGVALGDKKCRRGVCSKVGAYAHRDIDDGLYCLYCASVINKANAMDAPNGLIATTVREVALLVNEKYRKGAPEAELISFATRLLTPLGQGEKLDWVNMLVAGASY